MKKLLVILGLLVLVQGAALAQGSFTPGYYVDYFSNNLGPVPGAPDQLVRIINTGVLGTPLTSPVGDICADIYVFNNDQEMIACCAERITPNELDTASVGTQLTSNPLTSVVPPAGVIKIVLTAAGAACNPTTDNLAASSTAFGAVFGTHLQVTGGATSVTETAKLGYPLSTGVIVDGASISTALVASTTNSEAAFLQQACSFALYLGSGKGTCTSSVPGQ